MTTTSLKLHPAFFLALSLLIGMSAPLFWPSPWNFALPGLWALYLTWNRAWPFISALAVSALYSYLLIGTIPPPIAETSGLFSISSLQTHVSPFYKGLLYKGTLHCESRSLPCSIYYKGNPLKHPSANCDYFLEGKLLMRSPYECSFKPTKWEKRKGTIRFAEMRYQMKERFKKFLATRLSIRSASFLGSITTGDVEDRLLRYEFGRVGLQHLLAISGFHFAILLSICSFFCSLFLPKKIGLPALAFLVTLYFFFVGSSPAVQRSWCIALFYLLGEALGRRRCPLNLLGCGLILELLLDPLVASNVGFQLSFASTGGILLLYSPIEKLLEKLLPKRSKKETSQLNFWDKHIYWTARFLRRSLSLNFAVNLSIFPLLLYHFHQFPLLSLLYNLFIPVLIGPLLFLFILSLLFPIFFPLCDFLTIQILDIIATPPLALDWSLRISSLPAYAAALYLLALLWVALSLKRKISRPDKGR